MQEQKIRLLLVEDDKVDQMAFERLVKNQNLPYDYMIAGSVAQAREILSSDPSHFDLIVSDYVLGDGTSFELFSLYSGTPFIVTTGSGDEDVAVKAMKLGASDYIIKDPDGNYLKILPVTVDLALKRKQNEDQLQRYHEHLEKMVADRTAKLQESETKFRLLADYTYDWESWKGPEGECLYISPSCERITGYPPAEFKTNPQLLFDLVNAADKEAVLLHYADSANKVIPPHVMEFSITARNGEERWIEHRCCAVFDEHGQFAGRRSNNRDITERKKAEQARFQLEIQLRQKYKMEAMGVMAGGMAHNFNNNLSIILGNIELTKMKLSSASELGGYLDNAKIAVLRSRDLIKQIMSYSRQSEQDKTSLNLSLLVDETLQLLRATIPTTINLQQQSNDDSHNLTIIADPSQLQESLINLCNNAMHAMDETGILSVDLTTEMLQKEDIPVQYDAQPGTYAKLSVSDTGCGMNLVTIDKIFDLFYTTKSVDQGTGVGLSTVQGIVKDHGGLIKVRSALGKGTTFDLYFPVIEPGEKTDKSSENDERPEGSEHILFVDDDEMLAKLGQTMLTEMGYQVTMMTESQDALKLFAANADSFQLVITDQTMPGLTGKELIQELKKIRPNMRTIICTGFSSKVDEVEASRLGADAFLMKPLDLPQLLQVVRRVLDGGRDGLLQA